MEGGFKSNIIDKVSCKKCGARRGERCRAVRSQQGLSIVHAIRKKAYIRAMAEEPHLEDTCFAAFYDATNELCVERCGQQEECRLILEERYRLTREAEENASLRRKGHLKTMKRLFRGVAHVTDITVRGDKPALAKSYMDVEFTQFVGPTSFRKRVTFVFDNASGEMIDIRSS